MKFVIESQRDLSDAELESVYGSNLGVGGSDLGVGTSNSAAFSSRVHSFSFECDINTFSSNMITGELKAILNIVNCNTQICVNRD